LRGEDVHGAAIGAVLDELDAERLLSFVAAGRPGQPSGLVGVELRLGFGEPCGGEQDVLVGFVFVGVDPVRLVLVVYDECVALAEVVAVGEDAVCACGHVVLLVAFQMRRKMPWWSLGWVWTTWTGPSGPGTIDSAGLSSAVTVSGS